VTLRKRKLTLGVAGMFAGLAIAVIVATQAGAVASGSATDLAPANVPASSADTVIFGINLTSVLSADTMTAAHVVMTSVHNFSAADIADVTLWRDSNPANDSLDATDPAVSSGFSFDSCPSGTCTVTLTISDGTIPASGGSYTFFLTIRTSATIADGDAFTVTLPSNAFSVSPGPITFTPKTSKTITADTSPPAKPVVTALGLSKSVGKVHVGATPVSTETSGVLELWKTTSGACITGLSEVTEGPMTDLTATNTDLIGTDATQTAALEAVPTGTTTLCYRVRDEVGNESAFQADGVIPASTPSSSDVALLGVSNVTGLKRVYAAADTSGPRIFRLYLHPGGGATLERAKSQTGALIDLTTSISGPADSGTTDIKQYTSGTTLAAGDGVAYSFENANGNDGAVTNAGVIPAAPSGTDTGLLGTSAADGHQRVTAAADSSGPRTFGLYADPAGGTAWTRAVTSSGGTTPVRVITASGAATNSPTTTVFDGSDGTTALAAGHKVAYAVVNGNGNESDVASDGTIPAAPIAANISFSDALNQFVVNPIPASTTIDLYVGPVGGTATSSYDGTPDGAANSTSPVAVAEFGADRALFYTAVGTTGNESATTADGTIPPSPTADDIGILSTSAADGHQRLLADVDPNGSQDFRLYLDPAGGTAWARATTTSGGSTLVQVTTDNASPEDSGTTTIFSGTTAIAGGHSVGYADLVGGNESDVTGDGAIPAAVDATTTSVDGALDTFTATAASATYNVNLFVGTAGQTAAQAYNPAGPDATADSATPVAIDHPAATATIFYTATAPATGNESRTTADGSIPAAPSNGDIGLLGTSAATGHQRVTASTDSSGPRTFRLYLDPTGGSTWTRAATASGGSSPVDVTTSTSGATASPTTAIWSDTTPLAQDAAVSYAAVNTNGNNSDVTADGTIPGPPDPATTSASAAAGTATSTTSSAATNVRVFDSTSSDPATAYGEGVDQTLNATQTKTLASNAGDFLYYTALTTATGNESDITADGSIPAAPAPATTSASDALDQFVVPIASATNNVRIFLDASSNPTTAYGHGAAYTASASPFDANADLPGGDYVYYTTLNTGSGNESPIASDGQIPLTPSPASTISDIMFASAAEQVVTSTPDTTSRVLRLYSDPAGGVAWIRATRTQSGTTPVELQTSTSNSVTTTPGIFVAGSPMDSGASVGYSVVNANNNDSDVVSDGVIPATPTNPDRFSADAQAGTATLSSSVPDGIYRAFVGTTPVSDYTDHALGTPTTMTGLVLSNGDAIGYALFDDVSGNESPTLSDGTIPNVAVPDLEAASDTGSSSTDNITGDTTPTFDVSTDPGATATIFDGAANLGSAVANGSGVASPTSSTLTEGLHTITAQALNANGNTSKKSAGLPVTIETTGTRFHPIATTRIYSSGPSPLVAGVDRDILAAGVGGIPGNATAVVVNVEIQNPTQAGYIRVTPTGAPSQTAVQEFSAGETISNLVVVKVGTGGRINLHLSAGQATVFVDASGYYLDPADTTGDRFQPVATARIAGPTTLLAGSDQDVGVLGVGGIPASGVDAVVVNVEVQNPTQAGYIRVTPTGSPSQTAVQEFTPGKTISNLVVVKVGTGGKINLHLSAGSATFFIDAEGYFPTSGGVSYHALPTTRIAGPTTLTAGGDRDVTVLVGGVAPDASAVVVNVEIQSPTQAGYLRVTPAGSPSQTAVQEFGAGDTISNLVVVKVGSGGKITLHLSAGQAITYIDVEGYYGAT